MYDARGSHGGLLIPAACWIFARRGITWMLLLARFSAQFSRTAAENPEETVTSAALCLISARMAELADALRSGRSSRKGVEVRVLFRAPILKHRP
jgi:hypothetical protein